METKPEEENPYGFAALASSENPVSGGAKGNSLPKQLMMLIQAEYPIHFERLCQKVCPLLGREKVTKVVRQEVENALQSMKSRIVRKDDFTVLPGMGRSPRVGPVSVR